MTNSEIQDLLTLIYYPEERIKLIKLDEKDIAGWYKKTLLNLIKVLREISNKYTRSKVRKALPQDYAYIMDELINMTVESSKESYYENILSSIIELGEGDNFIIALCRVIQRLAIDHLHIIGDIYDRGNGPDIILDRLMNYHSLDIQWGNHDVLWIGAYLGNLACIANVIRINCGYKNLSILESSYGINLRALETFALKHYAGFVPCRGREHSWERGHATYRLSPPQRGRGGWSQPDFPDSRFPIAEQLPPRAERGTPAHPFGSDRALRLREFRGVGSRGKCAWRRSGIFP
jgi:fructose-1,6-bisphosphatase-3